jgi:aerobic carbon-monoxide dehydrogenase medium subunit
MLHRPESLGEAVGLLTRDADAKPLAGGASLVAMLNARLVEPTALVSLARIKEIHGSNMLPDGTLRLGAMTRHRELAEHTTFGGPRRVLQQAARAIANPTIRAMGTIGGSIALNDPGADYPPALVALSATIELVGPEGARLVRAADFFIDWYTTALAPGELVTAIHLPPAGGAGAGVYHKLALVAGDFAIVSVAVVLQAGGEAQAVIGACGPRPLWLPGADEELQRGNVAAAGAMLAGVADPVDDTRASANYRRRVIPGMLARAFAEASDKVHSS